MSVPTDVGVTREEGNGATSTHNVGFHFKADADLTVFFISTTGAETQLTLNTHYTVTGAGASSGGQITLLGQYANHADDTFIVIILDPDKNISTNFRNAGTISGAQLQTALDKLSQGLINLQSQVDRCIKLPWKETPSAAKTTIADATDRVSKNFTFDGSGNPSATTSISEGSLNFTAIGEDIAEAANAGAVLDALGFTTFTKTIVDDADAADVLTTLGVSSAAQTILDDASVAAIRSTLEIDGASGKIGPDDLSNTAIAQLFQARLTLTSATPVTTADVSSAGTIYLTPYKGNKIALYNGTRWKLHTLTEISLALTATSGKNYDVWVYDNSGTLTLETTEWTNNTTRATALATQDGVYCKTGAPTRRYVGTFRASGTNVTEDSSANRFVWNYYNRVLRPMGVVDSTDSWTYTTDTIRQARGAATNMLQFVVGVHEDAIRARAMATSANSSAGVYRGIGIGFDATAGWNANGLYATTYGSAANERIQHVAEWNSSLASGVSTNLAGYHFLSWNEFSQATGTTTWYGDNGGAHPTSNSGITGELFG